jgi:hypothetical protein
MARVLLPSTSSKLVRQARGGKMEITRNIDRQRVTLTTEVECLYWEAKLGAGRADIREAIDAAGSEPQAVERWLQETHRSHIRPTVGSGA